MRFAVVGAGAVGGYFGARLARAGHDVTFVARGAHLDAIRARGLSIESPLGDFVVRVAAECDPARVGPVDLVLFAVKTYDNHTALPLLPPMVGPRTIVLSLQNGVDSAEQVAGVVGEARTLGGTTYIATALTEPGVVVQTGVYRRIVLGECFGDRSRVSPRVDALARALADADIQVETAPDARVPIWEKFIYLAPLGGFAAAARRPAGAIWGDPFVREPFLRGVLEVDRVAHASGVPVSADPVARVTTYMNSVAPDMRPSMLIDLAAGKPIEVEALQGAVVRRGNALGVPTPVMATLYAVLKPHAEGRGIGTGPVGGGRWAVAGSCR
jgi:2-dehydropantoate 2-reductase